MTRLNDAAVMNTTATPTESAEAAAAVVASNDNAMPDAAVDDVGSQLRAAREKAGLSANDIAAKLRMGVKQVQALEANDFANLPEGTFLRGFVRNYAKLVGVNSDDMIAVLEKNHRGASVVSATRDVAPAQQNIKVQRPGGELATTKTRTLAALGVVAVLGGVAWYWWEFVRPGTAPTSNPMASPVAAAASTSTVSQPVAVALTPAQPPALPVAVEPAAAAGTQSPPAPAAPELAPFAPKNVPAVVATSTAASTATTPLPSTSLSAVNVPVAAPTIVASTAVVAAPAVLKPTTSAPGGSATLGFTFSGESWVEVTDANGKILISKRFKAGDAEEIFGRGPLSVVVGNAQVTRMAANGREFDLTPHTRVSVARVTVK